MTRSKYNAEIVTTGDRRDVITVLVPVDDHDCIYVRQDEKYCIFSPVEARRLATALMEAASVVEQ